MSTWRRRIERNKTQFLVHKHHKIVLCKINRLIPSLTQVTYAAWGTERGAKTMHFAIVYELLYCSLWTQVTCMYFCNNIRYCVWIALLLSLDTDYLYVFLQYSSALQYCYNCRPAAKVLYGLDISAVRNCNPVTLPEMRTLFAHLSSVRFWVVVRPLLSLCLPIWATSTRWRVSTSGYLPPGEGAQFWPPSARVLLKQCAKPLVFTRVGSNIIVDVNIERLYW